MLKQKRLFRILIISLGTWIVFSYIILPLRLEGQSMEPNYPDGGFRFCWLQKYLFSEPEHGDVVAIRFAGKRMVLLKRIVALAGETVEFRNGILYVNNQRVEEPYVRYRSNWNLPPRQVARGRVYVVGDNRGVSMHRHHFGQVDMQRILGGVLW
jgi:signal peptidase I